MAEAVFRHLAKQAGREHEFEADSAGTGGWHEGETADPRTLATLRRYAIGYEGRARPVRESDFDEFAHILVMDFQNEDDLRRRFPARADKVSLLLDWAESPTTRQVPDPYYGGGDGFERVYQLVTAGCKGLLVALPATESCSGVGDEKS